MKNNEIGIKYFATNRSMEDLGRDYTTEDHLKLRTSGYYWVDMVAYMGHYFGTVESDTLDKRNIVRKPDEKVFDRFLACDSVKRVVICVHGFNVHLYDSYTWFRILVSSMRRTKRPDTGNPDDTYGDLMVTHPSNPEDRERLDDPKHANSLTAFVGFSWPSNGNVLSYPSDQREAVRSASALANLIARIHSYDKEVSLVCHSMGNYLTCHMLAALVNGDFMPRMFHRDKDIASDKNLAKSRLDNLKKWQPTILREARRKDDKSRKFIERYVMIAPDVERRHVTKCVVDSKRIGTPEEQAEYLGPFYDGLDNLVGDAFNFYSRFDGALSISNVEKAPRKAAAAVKGALDDVTFGLFDFLERNPDQKWERRLGAAPHPPNAPRNIQSFNATEISGREIGHSDYIDSHEIAETIASLLID